MSYEKIDYALTNDVAFVRLNDPATLNAVDPQLGQELLDAVRRSEREARALLIGSVGRAFCSGAKLSEGTFDLDDPLRDAGAELDGIFNPVLYHIRNSEIPVVSAIRGAAAGVGCGIALSADIIVAGEGAFFFQAFRHVGLVPDGGSTYLLSRAIGRVRAMEMMMLGAKLPAAKALDWGLVTRVVADDDVDTVGRQIAGELARGPKSLSMIRKMAWAALDDHFETTLSNERIGQRAAGRTDDFKEGVTSFQEKRPAQFKGR
jgi:2-(1,2-epoxy-1,2-dihydrophenyl)acetyl-CoA isomerase